MDPPSSAANGTSSRSAQPGSSPGAEQRCELVTIVAEAGVGKTRLVAEAVARLGARVVGGRCLPYGEGITYWPVTAAAFQLEDVEVEERVREPLRAVLGDDIQTTPQEIAWAFRKLVEEAAPIVVVFDDVHWGEDVFLDLLEHIGLLATAPILLVRSHGPSYSTDARHGRSHSGSSRFRRPTSSA